MLTELTQAARSGNAQTLVMTLSTLLIGCQQVYGGRTEGTVGEQVLTELHAAYTMDASMTQEGGPADDRGLILSVSLTPNRNEPFMLAEVLKGYVEQGFPEQMETPSDPSWDRAVRFDDHIALLRDLDIIGSYAKSPNGRFAVVWSDEDDGRSSGRGAHSRWVLLDQEKVLSVGNCSGDACYGAISDVGRCLIASTLAYGEELRSELVGIEWSGKVFFSSRYEALPTAIAISDSARLGAVHFASSPGSTDGNALILLDLIRNQELWRRRIALYPRELVIREDVGLVNSILADGLTCSFHVDGRTALDDSGYVEYLKAHGASDELAAIAWARMEEVGGATAAEPALLVLETAVDKSADPYFKARTLRELGNAAEKAGLVDLTIKYWRGALQLSPQIGVKKRLADLERQVGATPAETVKPDATVEGGLEILAWYEGVRAEQVACVQDTVLLAMGSKGQTVISEIHSDGSVRAVCQLLGTTARLYPLSPGLLVLTDEGRIGDGQGWASLVNTGTGLVAQARFGGKLTEAALCSDLMAVGCRDGYLYGLGLPDLQERWRFRVPGDGDGFSPAHPYHVTAASNIIWISYIGTFWGIDLGGRQILQKTIDVPTEVAGLPNGTLVASMFKGVVLVNAMGSVKLTPVHESDPRVYGIDVPRGQIIIGRSGEGQSWYILDFDGRLLTEKKVGPCAQAELGPGGYLAGWDKDTVIVVDGDLERVGAFRQPDVTGNRVRAVAFEPDGRTLWVIGKGLWRLSVARGG
jgi:hypothetical protein